MHNKRFATLILACFISVSFCLPAALAVEIIVEDIEVIDLEAESIVGDYVVPDEGLEVGSVYLIDRAYSVVSMPEELEGATYIMTAMEDEISKGEFMSFTVEVPVIVWIAHDSRSEEEKGGAPPAWLSADEGWEKHPDMIIESTDGGMGFLILWSKWFDKGEIALRGNQDPPGSATMYWVILTLGQEAAVEATDKLSTTWAELKAKQL